MNDTATSRARRTPPGRRFTFADALICLIILGTFALAAPFLRKYAENITPGMAEKNADPMSSSVSTRTREYNVTSFDVDITVLLDENGYRITPLAAKPFEGGTLIFCRGTAVSAGTASSNRIRAVFVSSDGKTKLLDHFSYEAQFVEAFESGQYIYEDRGEGKFFISSGKAAFIYDTAKETRVNAYVYPQEFTVIHSALSHSGAYLAIAANEGLFILDTASNTVKELVASSSVSSVPLVPKFPLWSPDDGNIYYSMYAGDRVKNAGMCATLPGANEQLTGLDSTNFTFLQNGSLFYYYSQSSETELEDLFRCGYYNLAERRAADVMKSKAYYFGVGISQNGTHLATLSNNGNMVKFAVSDITSKKTIVTALFDEVYDFAFSPDENSVTVRARNGVSMVARVIQID
ncbi:hypothetical protein FACS1894105_03500 [Clostridia bacterium]|nr:hypothetical protein FACS1894105_03500 [Clostridia bacterium]